MFRRTFLFLAAATPIAARIAPAQAAAGKAETIAVIGTGEIGGSYGRIWAAKGHKIIYGARDPKDSAVLAVVHDTGHGAIVTSQMESAQSADIILFAVPYRVFADVLKSLGDISGKILICPLNNYYVERRGGYPYPASGLSIGEQVQQAAPTAKVVVALNSVRPEILNLPDVPGGAQSKPLSGGKSTALSFGPVSVAICGDDETAKLRVSGLIKDAGMEAADMGPITVAHWVEGLTALFVSYRTHQNGGKYTETGAGFEWFMRKVPN